MAKFALQITRNNFPGHLWTVWKDHDFETTLRAGFEVTGLFPYNPDVILSKAYVPPTVPSKPSENPENINFLLKLQEFVNKEGPPALRNGNGLAKMERAEKLVMDGKDRWSHI